MCIALLGHSKSLELAKNSDNPNVLLDIYRFYSSNTSSSYKYNKKAREIYEALAKNEAVPRNILNALYYYHSFQEKINVEIYVSLAQNKNTPEEIRHNLSGVAKSPFIPPIIREEIMAAL